MSAVDGTDDYRAQCDTLVRLIRHGIEALRDGDGDATTASATLANLAQLTARIAGYVDRDTVSSSPDPVCIIRQELRP